MQCFESSPFTSPPEIIARRQINWRRLPALTAAMLAGIGGGPAVAEAPEHAHNLHPAPHVHLHIPLHTSHAQEATQTSPTSAAPAEKPEKAEESKYMLPREPHHVINGAWDISGLSRANAIDGDTIVLSKRRVKAYKDSTGHRRIWARAKIVHHNYPKEDCVWARLDLIRNSTDTIHVTEEPDICEDEEGEMAGYHHKVKRPNCSLKLHQCDGGSFSAKIKVGCSKSKALNYDPIEGIAYDVLPDTTPTTRTSYRYVTPDDKKANVMIVVPHSDSKKKDHVNYWTYPPDSCVYGNLHTGIRLSKKQQAAAIARDRQQQHQRAKSGN